MSRTFLALAVLIALPLCVAAQEKITIKPSRDVKGDISNIMREEKNEESIRLIGPDGKDIQKKTNTVVVTSTFREEILEKTAGQRATKLLRTYDKAEVKMGDNVTPFAYAGKKLLIEKGADGYSFMVDGKALEPKDQGTLPRDFDPKRPSEEESEKIFLPGKPVAAGETWNVDAKTVLHSMSGKEQATKAFDIDKAKAVGKLSKTYKKNGALFGVIEFELTSPLKELRPGLPCKEGATLTLKMNVDACIDGTQSGGQAKTSTIMRGTAVISKDDKPTGATLEFDITNTVTSSGTPVKK
jgi:hypothetical protein